MNSVVIRDKSNIHCKGYRDRGNNSMELANALYFEKKKGIWSTFGAIRL